MVFTDINMMASRKGIINQRDKERAMISGD
jgi:hypothetical protein